MARDLDELIDAVRNDPEYIKFKKIIRTTRDKLRLVEDRDEAMMMLSGRTSRTIYGKKQFSGKSLMEAMANDMAARSRLVEMRLRVKVHLDVLSDACQALKDHVLTEYAEDMKLFSNAESRNAFVSRVQGTAKQTVTETGSLIDVFDQIIVDIDKASFHLSGLKEIILFIDSSKGSRNV
jgi:hypothetical protein